MRNNEDLQIQKLGFFKREKCFNASDIGFIINNGILNLSIKTDKNFLKTKTESLSKKLDINLALARNWSINSTNIDVNVIGNKVQLTGTVKSMYQRVEAAKIVRNAEGVNLVDNQLLVEYPY
jgi:osmotically-inducible protein OsmY